MCGQESLPYPRPGAKHCFLSASQMPMLGLCLAQASLWPLRFPRPHQKQLDTCTAVPLLPGNVNLTLVCKPVHGGPSAAENLPSGPASPLVSDKHRPERHGGELLRFPLLSELQKGFVLFENSPCFQNDETPKWDSDFLYLHLGWSSLKGSN